MAATGSNDKKIRIWDIKTGSLKSTLTGCLQSVMCVSFNATDELLLGASNDNAARLWHLGTGRPRVGLFFLLIWPFLLPSNCCYCIDIDQLHIILC